MKKYFHLIFPVLLFCNTCPAQYTTGEHNKPPKRYSHCLSIGVQIPWGRFSETHVIGAGAEHSWSRLRFGSDAVTYKKIGFIVNSGLHYFFGKNIITAGYGFMYGNYLSVYSMPGTVYNPLKKASLSLLAGPALNVYPANVNLGLAAQFSGSYSLSDRMAVSPGIFYRKRIHHRCPVDGVHQGIVCIVRMLIYLLIPSSASRKAYCRATSFR